MDELALDHCFWREMTTSSEFQEWFLSKTRFSDRDLKLDTNVKWHQRWYRDPEIKKDSETDIFLLFLDVVTNERIAIHIENKPAHRSWEPHQAENYRQRANDRMIPLRYTDFQIIVLCPAEFGERHAYEVSQFDFLLSYEEVGKFIPEFAAEVAAYKPL